MRATIHASLHPKHVGQWHWTTSEPACRCHPVDGACLGFGWCATQPEALAAALRHLATHHSILAVKADDRDRNLTDPTRHPKEDQS